MSESLESAGTPDLSLSVTVAQRLPVCQESKDGGDRDGFLNPSAPVFPHYHCPCPSTAGETRIWEVEEGRSCTLCLPHSHPKAHWYPRLPNFAELEKKITKYFLHSFFL